MKKIISSRELLEILKESSKLSCITINSTNLISSFNNDEICKYLKKVMTKLHIDKQFNLSFNNLNKSPKFYEIFSNIEQLIYYVIEPSHLLLLLNQLTKLSIIKIYLLALEQESVRLNFIFHAQGIDVSVPELSIWIDKNEFIIYKIS
ncbi:unnamed protein product [Rotaria sordida]|uniref:Uncharacterized protein n=1 Tax=Rotaria sordida TaxID=392033 RepID=A0A814UW00_9BILA|nr:unnamed protein product [Rotaria sordida]CAF1445259.1 unnamed protein product [Rotaria sordida]